MLFIDLSKGASHVVDYKIEDDDQAKFWSNEKFTQYLYSNRPFPPLWSWQKSIHTLPKGKKLGYGADTCYDGFPATTVLDFPLENFRICVDDSHYFMSQLPLLEVSSSNTEKWSDRST